MFNAYWGAGCKFLAADQLHGGATPPIKRELMGGPAAHLKRRNDHGGSSRSEEVAAKWDKSPPLRGGAAVNDGLPYSGAFQEDVSPTKYDRAPKRRHRSAAAIRRGETPVAFESIRRGANLYGLVALRWKAARVTGRSVSRGVRGIQSSGRLPGRNVVGGAQRAALSVAGV